MFSYEFFYLPAKYLNYSDFSQFVSEIKYLSSYEGISIESPSREHLRNKIVTLAKRNGKTVAYRFAEFIKIPKNMRLLFIYDTVSTPAIFKKDINYDIFYNLVKNLVLRFRIFENTYVCCINDNFFDVQRFESDFLDGLSINYSTLQHNQQTQICN